MFIISGFEIGFVFIFRMKLGIVCVISFCGLGLVVNYCDLIGIDCDGYQCYCCKERLKVAL